MTQCSTAVILLCNWFEIIFGKEKAPVVRPGLKRRRSVNEVSATAITNEIIL
jgi:hypothetical protein